MATPSQVLEFAVQEAQRLNVPVDLVRNTLMAESGGRTDLVSSKGAIGPMQLMPTTAKGLGVDPNNWQQNVTGGVQYLGKMLDRFGGDAVLASAAYNAGPGNVEKHGGVPPFKETQNYVKKVTGMADNKDDEFIPYSASNQPQAKTSETDEFIPYKPQQQQAATPQKSFTEQFTESFSPLDVARGKTMTGQTAIAAFKGLDKVTLQALAAMGNKPAQDLLSEQAAARAAQPKEPSRSISDIIGQTVQAVREQPGAVLGSLGTQMLDPSTWLAPGGFEKALAASIPAKVAAAAPKLTKAATMTGAAAGLTGAEGVTRAGAEGRQINAGNLGSEMGASALMALPFSVTGGAMTRNAGAPLTAEQQAMADAVAQGLKMPPSQLTGGPIASSIEALLGKKAMGAQASIANKEIVANQAKQVLGLADNQTLDADAFTNYRKQQGQAYDALKKDVYDVDNGFNDTLKDKLNELSINRSDSAKAQRREIKKYVGDKFFTGEELVANIKQLRADSTANMKGGSLDPVKYDLGKTQRFLAESLEDLADRNLSQKNQPDMLKNFRDARTNIAKSHTLEDAFNDATTEVKMSKIGERIAARKIVPSELEVAGRAQQFAKNYFSPSSSAASGLTGAEGLSSMAALLSGRPDLATAVAARGLGRSVMLSGPVQRALAPNAPLPARTAPAGLTYGLQVPGLLPYVGAQ